MSALRYGIVGGVAGLTPPEKRGLSRSGSRCRTTKALCNSIWEEDLMIRLTFVLALALAMVFALFGGSAVQAATVTAYYDFEGNFNDYPGAGVVVDDLTPTGGSLVADPAPALGSTQSYQFDNKLGYQTAQTNAWSPDLTGNDAAYTVMFWIKADNAYQMMSNTRLMSMKHKQGGGAATMPAWQVEGFGGSDPDSMDLRIQGGIYGNWFSEDADGALDNDGDPSNDIWHHVAFVISNAGSTATNDAYMETYVDGLSLGQAVASSNTGLPVGSTDGELIVGGHNSASRGATGLMDDLALFEGIVSGDDIRLIAQGQLSPADFIPSDVIIPEPSTLVIWALGLLGLAWYARRPCGCNTLIGGKRMTTQKTIVLTLAFAMVALLPGLAQGAAAVYEPFDYQPGALNGKGGTTEVGLTGTWVTNSGNIQAVVPGLTWNDLAVSGNSQQRNADNFGYSDRAIAPGALAGMLDDGDTLWFSYIARMGWDGQQRNYFSIGSDGFQHSAYNHWGGLGHVPQWTVSPEQGMGTGSETRGNIFAVSNPPNSPMDSLGWDVENWGSPRPDILGPQNDVALVVGKIAFGTGGADDVLEIYVPSDMDTLGLVQSSISADLDQTQWDTISMFQKSYPGVDEIRIGATLADVMPRAGADVIIPEPSTLVIWALGLLGLLARGWRRRFRI